MGELLSKTVDPLREGRLEIRAALEARRGEVEANLLNRIKSIVDTDAIDDPEYVEGLQRSIPAGFDFALSGITASERHPPPIPTVLMAQARLAARNRLEIVEVMRRYEVCRTVVEGALAEEAEARGLAETVKLADLLRSIGVLFDRLLATVGSEHRRERVLAATSALRRLRLVRGALSGESLALADLNYDFDAFHVGLIAKGTESAAGIQELADSLDCALLVVRNEDGATWAWCGKRVKPDIGQLKRLVSDWWPKTVRLGVGEPAHGPVGWRRSHLQAGVAFLLAQKRGLPFCRYGDNPVLASLMRDDLLAGSLREIYLKPLAQERDGGIVLIKTIRAYIDSERNISSTAAALRVTRQTVTNRVRRVEQRIGRSFGDCSAELDIALRLAEIESRGSPREHAKDSPA